jgi:hypothetical protein
MIRTRLLVACCALAPALLACGSGSSSPEGPEVVAEARAPSPMEMGFSGGASLLAILGLLRLNRRKDDGEGGDVP